MDPGSIPSHLFEVSIARELLIARAHAKVDVLSLQVWLIVAMLGLELMDKRCIA